MTKLKFIEAASHRRVHSRWWAGQEITDFSGGQTALWVSVGFGVKGRDISWDTASPRPCMGFFSKLWRCWNLSPPHAVELPAPGPSGRSPELNHTTPHASLPVLIPLRQLPGPSPNSPDRIDPESESEKRALYYIPLLMGKPEEKKAFTQWHQHQQLCFLNYRKDSWNRELRDSRPTAGWSVPTGFCIMWCYTVN